MANAINLKTLQRRLAAKRKNPLRRGRVLPKGYKSREKKCKVCKDKFQPRTTIQSTCFKSECILEFDRLKRAKKDRIEEKIRDDVRREKLKTLSQHEAEAKKAFQKWVRYRDRDLACISCFKKNCTDWAGGHYLDAGIYSGLIFHPDNCHKQCNSHCNGFLGGNKVNYRIGLINRIGEEKVKWLEENKDRLKNYKYTKTELTEIKNKYLRLLKAN